jgi:hypothetical protein
MTRAKARAISEDAATTAVDGGAATTENQGRASSGRAPTPARPIV